MDKESYRRYLRSVEWKEKRQEFLRAANYQCEECGSTKNLQVHHITYEHVGNETEDDVMVLCERCHEDKEIEKGTDLYGGYDDSYGG